MRPTLPRGAILIGALFAVACGESSARTAQRSAGSKAFTIGDPVPEYRAATLAGPAVAIGSGKAPLTLVNVWATWCTSCREEMEDLAVIHRDYAPRGLRVVAVSVDAGSEALVQRFVRRERLPFPVVHDQAGRIQQQYHIVGVPTSYLIGTDGRLLWQQTGGIHGNLPQVRVALEKVIR